MFLRPKPSVMSCDSILHASSDPEMQMKALHTKAGAFLNLGQEQKAIGYISESA